MTNSFGKKTEVCMGLLVISKHGTEDTQQFFSDEVVALKDPITTHLETRLN